MNAQILMVVVNGEEYPTIKGTSIRSLVESLRLLPEATAVQRNDAIVPRAAYGTTMLEEGDVIELVRFVGGG